MDMMAISLPTELIGRGEALVVRAERGRDDIIASDLCLSSRLESRA